MKIYLVEFTIVYPLIGGFVKWIGGISRTAM